MVEGVCCCFFVLAWRMFWMKDFVFWKCLGAIDWEASTMNPIRTSSQTK